MRFRVLSIAAYFISFLITISAYGSDVVLQINGQKLSKWQSEQINLVKNEVVPRISGTHDEQVKTAALGLWWALREGIVSDWARRLVKGGNINRYNACTTKAGDIQIPLMEACGMGQAWQVGLAGVQVYNDRSARAWKDQYSRIQKIIDSMPGSPTEADILAESARLAGVDQATVDAIQKLPMSPLRNSWLLRFPAIGIVMSVKFAVLPECYPPNPSAANGKVCFNKNGLGAVFSPDSATSQKVVGDLEAVLR